MWNQLLISCGLLLLRSAAGHLSRSELDQILLDFQSRSTTTTTTTANPLLERYKMCDHHSGEEARCVKNSICTQPDFWPGPCELFQTCCPESQIKLAAPPVPLVPRLVGCGYSNPGGIALRSLTSDNGNADFGEFPWMVALMKKNVTGDKFHDAYFGGGTLIHPSIVLTVAHKVDEISASNLKCRAGEWDTNSQDEIHPHQDRDARKIIIHEEYERVYRYNDFALIILEKPFDLGNSPHIGVACLERQLPQAGTECYSMGWGEDFRTSERKNATTLKKITLPIVEKNKCQNAYRNSRLGMFYNTHYSFVCAGGLPNLDTCVGDGGSPLVCPIADKEHVRYSVVGLVSYGLECGSSVPTVHANIPEAYNWILTQYALEGFSNPAFTTLKPLLISSDIEKMLLASLSSTTTTTTANPLLQRCQPCSEGEVTGVCRRIYECPFAKDLVNIHHKKPPTCGYDEDVKIVCCPSQGLLYRTGTFKEYFKASNDGVIRSKDLTCRYEGKQPLLCCQNAPDVPEAPEPKQCPPLPKPKIHRAANLYQKFAWKKCISYQRYFNKCISVDESDLWFKRINTCGRDPTSSQFRISEGYPALPREFPHMAVIGCHNPVYTDDVDVIWVGGGSLISERFILTAAHIISENKLGRVRYALLGALNKTDIKSGILCNIIRTTPHKLYEKGEKHHDIAILELNERVKFNEFVRPACLPLTKADVDDERIIAGWGETSEGGKRSAILLKASVTEDEIPCRQKLDTIYRSDMMICARGSVRPITEDTCKGDSGGPLMALFKNLSCSYSIEGIVSFGPRCGKSAGVYTKVAFFLDWIIENVWPEEFKEYKELVNK